ncbi:MAG: YbaN family protein [Pseudomonadota bacterium]
MKTLIYRLLGFLALGLATVGAILPVMPSTCFVILAAWCFAKSSPYWHQRLVDSRWFGPTLQQWEHERCISPRARLIAIGSMLVFGTLSFFIIDSLWLRILLMLLICSGIISVHLLSKNRRRNTCPINHEK